MKRHILTLILVPVLLVFLFSVVHTDRTHVTELEKAGAEAAETVQSETDRGKKAAQNSPDTFYAEKSGSTTHTITLGAIGDILIHAPVYQSARSRNGFDFRPTFHTVKAHLLEPDILTANQESIWGGKKLGLSGYPQFNSPQEVGSAVKDAGVDILSTANNHALDKGEAGQVAALSYMDKISIKHVGTYLSAADRNRTETTSTHGIRVAWLSYTYGTNGIPVPKGKDYLVNLLDRNRMRTDIREARKQADIVVMSMHWGIEYQQFPGEEQKSLARFLVNEGVDIIFGSHPHVLQPMEWLKAADGRRALVVYSLGNFLSGQEAESKKIGGMATVKVTKKSRNGFSSVQLSDAGFFPTYVAQIHKSYRVVPLKAAGAYGLPDAGRKYNEIMNHVTGKLHEQ